MSESKNDKRKSKNRARYFIQRLKHVNFNTLKKRVIMTTRQRITKSVNDKFQQRTIGKRTKRNFCNHFVNTIGSEIDTMIRHNNFTKKEIMSFAGTKMSKVNSHINHLRKDKKMSVLIDKNTKIVRFASELK